jgi:hypothetical protein
MHIPFVSTYDCDFREVSRFSPMLTKVAAANDNSLSTSLLFGAVICSFSRRQSPRDTVLSPIYFAVEALLGVNTRDREELMEQELVFRHNEDSKTKTRLHGSPL